MINNIIPYELPKTRDMVEWHRKMLYDKSRLGKLSDEQMVALRDKRHRIPYNHYRRQLRKEMIRLIYVVKK